MCLHNPSVDLFGETASILNCISSNTYYGILRGEIRMYLHVKYLSARLQDVLTDESTEDDIWPHNSSKHRIYSKTSHPSQEAKSSEMDKSSSSINSASDNSSLV